MIRERWSNFHGAGRVGALHPVQVQSGRLRVLPRNRQDLPCLVKRGGNSGLEGWMEKLFLFSQVEFVLDYTPKFIVPPIVYEKVWMHPLRQSISTSPRWPPRWAKWDEVGTLSTTSRRGGSTRSPRPPPPPPLSPSSPSPSSGRSPSSTTPSALTGLNLFQIKVKLTFFNDSAQSGVPIPEHRVGRECVHTNVRTSSQSKMAIWKSKRILIWQNIYYDNLRRQCLGYLS